MQPGNERLAREGVKTTLSDGHNERDGAARDNATDQVGLVVTRTINGRGGGRRGRGLGGGSLGGGVSVGGSLGRERRGVGAAGDGRDGGNRRRHRQGARNSLSGRASRRAGGSGEGLNRGGGARSRRLGAGRHSVGASDGLLLTRRGARNSDGEGGRLCDGDRDRSLALVEADRAIVDGGRDAKENGRRGNENTVENHLDDSTVW